MLVAGGAGRALSVTSLIEFAVWAGATVIATISSDEKAALARSAGAHHIEGYRDDDAADQVAALAPGGIDHIVEESDCADRRALRWAG